MDVEETTIKDIESPDVVDKYKIASEIANRVMLAVLEFIKPGMKIVDVCAFGDKMILELTSAASKKVKNKGIGFPTCVSVNNCAGHMSPLPEDSDTVALLKAGDLVKVDLGAHIDGYVSTCAHTWILPLEGQEEPFSGRIADVVCAAYYASECALHLLQPGRSNTEVTKMIKAVADVFHVHPVEAVLSHQMKQNCIDANNVILNREELDQHVDEFKFETNQVYAIDILMSTGEGKTREITNRTTVFKRALDRNYQLKLQASRQIFSEINSKCPTLPFSLTCLDEKKRRMGISEIVKHELVDSYPVLWEKEGEHIAQFKFTVLILPTVTEKLTAAFPLPGVTSQYNVTEEIQQCIGLSLKRAKKKKPKKKVAAPAAAPPASGAPSGSENK
jgi:curved DNA binding protein